MIADVTDSGQESRKITQADIDSAFAGLGAAECPSCGARKELGVEHTRKYRGSKAIYRERICFACGFTWKTREM